MIGKNTIVLLGKIWTVKATIILTTFALGMNLFDLEIAQTMPLTAFVVQGCLQLAVSLALQLTIVYGTAQAWLGVTALDLVP